MIIIQKLRSNMEINIVGAIVLLLALFGVVNGASGLVSFSEAFKQEYSTSTYHMADTAASLVNGDHLEDYLAGRETEEYRKTRRILDAYCHKMSVSLIYVILVDQSDYGRFVSVFNLVDNTVDDTSYTEWELGHKRDTTNNEYREKYRSMYEQAAPYETVYRVRTTDGQHPHITTMVPVLNSSGETAAILCVQRPVRELTDARKPYIRNIALSTLFLAIFSSVFAAYYIRSLFVAPVRKVSAEATRFARENVIGEPLEGISKYAELASLAQSIDTMETDMVNYIGNLTKATAEKERIATELSLAKRIQKAMLPSVFPPFPERGEIDIYASMDPARDVGGDFYDYFFVDDDHLCLVMADVSGKGIAAALFMTICKITMKNYARQGLAPSEVLQKTNEMICANNPADMFVTVWIGVLELSTGCMTACNAGHEYPVILYPGRLYEIVKDKHGFVVGGFDTAAYKDYELQLGPGSRLFLYTDGLPEAKAEGPAMNMFGLDRMLEALNRDPDLSPMQVLENMKRSVAGFVQEEEQFDDLTMLCLEYRGSGS